MENWADSMNNIPEPQLAYTIRSIWSERLFFVPYN
jgi:hypothetical protein